MSCSLDFPSSVKIICAYIIIGAVFCLTPAFGQGPASEGYMMPPKVIADLIDAPPTPFVSISPDNQWMMIQKWPGYPPLEEVAQPELRLAGLRINPRTNGPSRGWHDPAENIGWR